MQNFIISCAKFIRNLVSPSFCAHCNSYIEYRAVFCYDCESKIEPVFSGKLDYGKNLTMTIIAVSDYKNPIKKLILGKQWSNRSSAAKLGELIWEKTCFKNLDFDYLVPIPLHWTRYARRGYNQTEIIANILSQKSGKPVLNILRRKTWTQFQFKLVKSERSKNVSGVFELTYDANILRGKKIMLVDDLATTGSTLQSAAKVLTRAKPASIDAVVPARVI